jgi:hypothetical protein
VVSPSSYVSLPPPLSSSQVLIIDNIVAQFMGSAFIIPAAQAIFQSQLIKCLRVFAPDVDPLVVLGAGATSRGISSLPKASVLGIVESYVNALRSTFALGVAVARVAFLVSFFMPWFRFHNVGEKEKEAGRKPEIFDGSG